MVYSVFQPFRRVLGTFQPFRPVDFNHFVEAHSNHWVSKLGQGLQSVHLSVTRRAASFFLLAGARQGQSRSRRRWSLERDRGGHERRQRWRRRGGDREAGGGRSRERGAQGQEHGRSFHGRPQEAHRGDNILPERCLISLACERS